MFSLPFSTDAVGTRQTLGHYRKDALNYAPCCRWPHVASISAGWGPVVYLLSDLLIPAAQKSIGLLLEALMRLGSINPEDYSAASDTWGHGSWTSSVGQTEREKLFLGWSKTWNREKKQPVSIKKQKSDLVQLLKNCCWLTSDQATDKLLWDQATVLFVTLSQYETTASEGSRSDSNCTRTDELHVCVCVCDCCRIILCVWPVQVKQQNEHSTLTPKSLRSHHLLLLHVKWLV